MKVHLLNENTLCQYCYLYFLKFIGKYHTIKRSLIALAIILSIQLVSYGQNIENLSDLKVEELTDDQVRRFLNEVNRIGLSYEQVEQMALQRGMNPVELAKLKDRVQSYRKALSNSSSEALLNNQPSLRGLGIKDSISLLEQKPLNDFNGIFSELQLRNFGSEVFHNSKVTFEPNLNIPTPTNYQLAADDELLIDVFGYSEANYKLKVSPEGSIRIPLVGPVPINGLTIEQAKKVIAKRMSNTIYTDIKTGNTSIEVTLGSIRSIKVDIIGEATVPGTFTLPSLATVYHALHACGGPNSNGSFRDIQLIRDNTVIAVIDVYQYLLNGKRQNDLRLMDRDVIKVNTYQTRVELKGEVKKPGLYDVLQGEALGDLLNYAGGFSDNAYTSRIQVYRNSSKERQVTTIGQNSFEAVIPQKGDTYIIGKILNRFTNRISIKGAVFRPGDYELKDGMTLLQLIGEADGIREDAFTSRATIHRLKPDLSPEILSFDLEKLLSGRTPDIALLREDRIHIYSKFDLKEGYYVMIEGEVSSPGIFLYEQGIRVQDLILMAGGMKESASVKRIEISRRVKDADPTASNTKTAIIFQQDISSDLRDSAAVSNFVLLPFDEVSIRPAPEYSVQKNAVIEGEVLYTGKYTLEAKNDRISDLIKRSGGLTTSAYLRGAVLVRTRNYTRAEQDNALQGFKNLLKQNYRTGVPTEILLNDYTSIVIKKSDHVGIDLERIMEDPGSEFDLFLNDGDTLRIPKLQQTVRVSGEVLYPALVRYDDQLTFKDYILGAGGFSDRSAKRRSYVVYANGSVKGTKSFLFFRNYPRLSPGAEIFVPNKRERERLRTGEVITVGATVVSMLAILFNVLR
jgi:protein involved in polysaccharide export with SLBB domain